MEDFQKDLVNTFEKIKGSSDPTSVMSANKAIDKIESNETISKKNKKETREATGTASAGAVFAPISIDSPSKETTNPISGKVPEVRENQKGFKAPKLTMFSDEAEEYKLENKEINEKWSQKYKNSIDCSNPKGFSQRAHCQGKVKKSETKEGTGAASSGSYSQPSIWAKSTNKKDWAAARKTQIPGGQFVTVKKKCTKFPYCNQGDIKALKLWENETMKKVISNVCDKTGLDENTVKAIIQYELEISGKIL